MNWKKGKLDILTATPKGARLRVWKTRCPSLGGVWRWEVVWTEEPFVDAITVTGKAKEKAAAQRAVVRAFEEVDPAAVLGLD